MVRGAAMIMDICMVREAAMVMDICMVQGAVMAQVIYMAREVLGPENLIDRTSKPKWEICP